MADNLSNKILALLLGAPSTPEIDGLKRALAEAIAKSELPPATPSIDRKKHSEKLQQLQTSLARKHSFSVGQLVRWKPGMRNRGFPAYDQPGIVVEVLPAPIIDLREPVNSTSYREPLDIRIGIYWEPTEEIFIYHFNSERFEPMTAAVS